MKAVAIIHEEKPQTVTGVLDTEMTREDLLRIISGMHTKMQRMQEDYDALLAINKLLERQNYRLLKEKFERMERELSRSGCLIIKR